MRWKITVARFILAAPFALLASASLAEPLKYCGQVESKAGLKTLQVRHLSSPDGLSGRFDIYICERGEICTNIVGIPEGRAKSVYLFSDYQVVLEMVDIHEKSDFLFINLTLGRDVSIDSIYFNNSPDINHRNRAPHITLEGANCSPLPSPAQSLKE